MKFKILNLIFSLLLMVVAIAAADAAIPPLMNGLSWEAEEGLIEGNFVVEGNVIRHNGWALESIPGSIASRGVARYRFNIQESGKYIVVIRIKGESLSNNSFLINMDRYPTSPTMICDFPVTKGFEQRVASWRGDSTENKNEFSPKEFYLEAGEHTLYILGREANTTIDNITIEKVQELDKKPLVFTPDGDGNYDQFFIEEIGEAKIFDRNGNLIAEFQAPGFWDGRDRNGNIVSSGAYILQLGEKKPKVINVVR